MPVPVLLYHSLDDNIRTGITIPTSLFGAHMRAWREAGYRPLTIDRR